MSEAQMSDMDRRSLLSRLKEQFQLNVATSQAENNRNQGLQILFHQMERMPNNMRLKTIEKLTEIGALGMTAATTGTSVPGARPPMDSIQRDRPASNPVKEAEMLLEAIKHSVGLPGGGSQPSLGDRPASNPVKEIGELLEALQHIATYFKENGPLQIEPSRNDS
jgi:hypothetical protein